jgi:hypothetical protein
MKYELMHEQTLYHSIYVFVAYVFLMHDNTCTKCISLWTNKLHIIFIIKSLDGCMLNLWYDKNNNEND